ncbi:MAG: TerD family protein [Oscillospiraceae bacterium]|nr:TerD family protein [Oscillospiraceae bacterium]
MFNIPMKTKPPASLDKMTQNEVKITMPQDLGFAAHTAAMQQSASSSGTAAAGSSLSQQSYGNQQNQYNNQQTQNRTQQPYGNQQGYGAGQNQYNNQQSQNRTQQPQNTSPAAPVRKRPALPPPAKLLRKGEKFSLTKNAPGTSSLRVGIGWDFSTSTAYDVDIEAFMLNEKEVVPDDSWIVFYGQLQSPDRSVTHRGDSSSSGSNEPDCEQIDINLTSIDKRITKIALVVTINEAKLHGYNFSGIKNAYIRISDLNTKKEIVRYELTDYYREVVSMVVGELYFRNGEWRFNPVGMGTGDDLEGLCNRYGIEVI